MEGNVLDLFMVSDSFAVSACFLVSAFFVVSACFVVPAFFVVSDLFVVLGFFVLSESSVVPEAPTLFEALAGLSLTRVKERTCISIRRGSRT